MKSSMVIVVLFFFKEEIRTYNVSTAPTLIILDKDKEIFRGSEIYEIEEFLKKNK